MASTTNLGMTVDLSTTLRDAENDVPAHLAAANNNFKKIDEFAGKIYGTSGELVLPTEGWQNNEIEIAVEQLGANDIIVLTPKTKTDRDNAEAARLFSTAQAGSITVAVDNIPIAAITFKYFIARGK